MCPSIQMTWVNVFSCESMKRTIQLKTDNRAQLVGTFFGVRAITLKSVEPHNSQIKIAIGRSNKSFLDTILKGTFL